MKNIMKKVHGGFIATSTVLVLMVVTLSIMTTVSLLGIGEAQGALALTKGEQSLALTEGCVEEMLLGVKNSNTYAGGVITRPEGSCTVIIDTNIGNVWTITVTPNSTDYVRSIRVVLTRGAGVVLTSWQEI